MRAVKENTGKASLPKKFVVVTIADRQLHKSVKLAALNKDQTIVQFVEIALRKALGQPA